LAFAPDWGGNCGDRHRIPAVQNSVSVPTIPTIQADRDGGVSLGRVLAGTRGCLVPISLDVRRYGYAGLCTDAFGCPRGYRHRKSCSFEVAQVTSGRGPPSAAHRIRRRNFADPDVLGFSNRL